MTNREESLVLDTHVFLWVISGDLSLPPHTRELLGKIAAKGKLYLSAISLWEIAILEKKDRINLKQPCLQWLQNALTAPSIQLISLSPEIAVESCNLPGEFHGDPADRMIVATARCLGSRLMTRDKRVLGYAQEGHLSCIEA